MLRFLTGELLYDVRTLAFVEADVTESENVHLRHELADIGEDGNVDRVMRMMRLAVARCADLLSPYAKHEVEDDEARDDVHEEPDAFEIVLSLPDDFSKERLTLLEHAVHEYVVCSVMSDWVGVVCHSNVALVQAWKDRVENAESEIDGTLHSRTRRVRRTQTPF
ncbi:MAG: hypothetical protein ACI4OZ_09185 [Akkermansia sp.]